MAFPGTFNFSYYRGDTYQFIVRPKNESGASFQLDGFSAIITIADRRGAGGTRYASTTPNTLTAIVNTADDIITCTIDPVTGRLLTPGTNWLYDVQVTNGTLTYTLLTGSISVTDDITGAQ
jgi:hypothetical protein